MRDIHPYHPRSPLVAPPSPRMPRQRPQAQRGLAAAQNIRPRPPVRERHQLLLDLPIAWRLTVGFLLAALIAAVASGAPGLQRAQALSQESAFYQSLLQANTTLTSGDSFLQLMNTKVHDTLLDAAVTSPSRETLATDQTAVQGLATRYDTIVGNYIRTGLLDQHPGQVALLAEANHSIQVTQQRTLASSVLRTWQVYYAAQSQVLQDVAVGDVVGAQTLERAQAEPTSADALSALRALIQFDGRIAASVHDAALVDQQSQLVTAIVAAVLAFLAIALVGWIISNTLVRRLRHLRRVTQDVEQGEVERRVTVTGRDEVAGVSASVNGMLDTIVGLLDVTRRQRDALTNAAERLFADVRVAGAGDLRVNAAVSADPIGMLANAFNFTVGRFRRFALRTQSAVDQLDIVGRQEYERAETFLAATRQIAQVAGAPSQPAGGMFPFTHGMAFAGQPLAPGAVGVLDDQIARARELVREVATTGSQQHARAVLDLAEQAYLSAGRLNHLITSAMSERPVGSDDRAMRAQVSEVRTLSSILARLGADAQAVQKSSGTRLLELDAALDRLAVAVGSGSVLPAGAPLGTIGSAQADDLVRLAGAFAQDVAALARQTLIITQEMRTSLSPFRLEAGEQGDTMLFAPSLGPQGPMA